MVCIIKAMAFPGVVHRCNSWIIHKAECQRIDAFKLWCWKRLLRVSWKARKPIDGGKAKTVTDFIFLGSKTTADSDCSHEIKRHLLLGRKSMTNLDGVLKSRDIILPTKVCIVKAMVFPVVMYGCESWNIKKAER